MSTEQLQDLTPVETRLLNALYNNLTDDSAKLSEYLVITHNEVLAMLWKLRERGYTRRVVHGTRPMSWHVTEKYKPAVAKQEPESTALNDHMKALHTNELAENDPKAMDAEQVHELIVGAITNDFRTFNGIKHYARFPKWSDISGHLHHLQDIGRIKKRTNANCTAYFLADEDPIDFDLAGDGTVEVVFASASPVEEPDKTPEEPRAPVQAHVSGSQHGRYKHIDRDTARKVAAEHGTLKAVADHFGFTPSGLSSKFKREPDLKSSVQQGLDEWLAAHETKPEPVETAPMEIEEPPSLPNQIEDLEPVIDDEPQERKSDVAMHLSKMTEAVLEELAFQGLTVGEAAAQLDIPYHTFHYLLYKTASSNTQWTAWKRGQQRRAESIAKPGNGLIPSGNGLPAPAADNGHDEILNLGRLVINKIDQLRSVEAASAAIPNQKAVRFGDSGTLIIAFDGNLFGATEEERMLFNDIIDLVQQYEKNKG